MNTGFTTRTYYSIQHVQAAAYLTRCADRFDANQIEGDPIQVVALKAYALSALFSSVAFLEALVNEMFADAMLPFGGHLSVLSNSTRDAISSAINDKNFLKMSTLCKYELLLKNASCSHLQKGRNPYQAVKMLIKLRNEFTHYKASFLDVGTQGMVRLDSFHSSELARYLDGKFVPRNSEVSISSDNLIGHGLAEWAVKAVIAYADEIFNKLGVDPYFDHVRCHLGTKAID